MKLHEHQAKALLHQFGVPIPAGVPILSLQDLTSLQPKLPPAPWVLKAQVHAGGRGKAGGIVKARTWEELQSAVRSLFGKKLITAQTGPEGTVVQKLYVEQAQEMTRELYLACVLDRSKAQPVLLASQQGGVEIEELAGADAQAIIYEPFDPVDGLAPYQARLLAQRLGLQGVALGSVAEASLAVARAFLAYDASLIEINPLGLTATGKTVALDAKITLDDNALFRHPDAQGWRDFSEENPLDVRASQAGVNYIALEGSIGCLVNGAGLAMATMDLIKHHGGEPANFLDVEGAPMSSK